MADRGEQVERIRNNFINSLNYFMASRVRKMDVDGLDFLSRLALTAQW